ncbi:LacI family DNA-binding transcriptional regulator [Lapidilactobacillus wuchangensis]|uniref:LacI family DNA-binding transcriptional regulator n=1 Tax=Lapidilactobacillus wuchangensis TaxID=2486001 RepID=UPI000F78F0DC|nr:LacI family DNA-binding transcriptional regulator [Lapidilactobacillus wuchangensis]
MKKTSLKQIAEIAQVSVATVSYALNDSSQVGEVTKAKIKKIAADLNYVPNLSAQNLRTNDSNIVCAVVNTYQGNFNGDVIQEIQDIFAQKKYQLLAVSGSIPNFVKTDMVDGLIVLNYRSDEAELRRIAYDLHKPTIFMTNEIAAKKTANVIINNELGIKYLFETLSKSVHRNICIITGDNNSYNSQQRLKAARKYYKKFYKHDDFDSHVYSGDFDPNTTYQLGRHFLEQNTYNAYLCFNDDMALGIYHAASSLNKTVGEDLSVVGFDDSYVSSVVSPGLTTIKVNKKTWAEEVVDQYFKIKSNSNYPETIELIPELILRDSVKLK